MTAHTPRRKQRVDPEHRKAHRRLASHSCWVCRGKVASRRGDEEDILL